MTAFAGTFSDIRLVKTRSVAQVVIEIPIEQFASFVSQFGAPGRDTWVGIARLNAQPNVPERDGRADMERDEGRRAVAAAAMKCKEEPFQRWLLNGHYSPGDPEGNEMEAINQLRIALGIKSRAEIGSNPEKLREWKALLRRVENDTREDGR